MIARFSFIVCVLLLILPLASNAQSAWVSDEFEVTLRTGPSTGNAIELMVSSGTELTVLERDADSGYARVRTRGGTEGWVLSRYLMNEPSAREQLESLSAQLTSANTRGSSLDSQLSGIREQYSSATETIETLSAEKASLEAELAEIRRTAANVLAINSRNTELLDELADARITIGSLEQENRELSGESARMWVVVGAAIIGVGILIGLWLPRIRWQRRSRYDRF